MLLQGLAVSNVRLNGAHQLSPKVPLHSLPSPKTVLLLQRVVDTPERHTQQPTYPASTCANCAHPQTHYGIRLMQRLHATAAAAAAGAAPHQ